VRIVIIGPEAAAAETADRLRAEVLEGVTVIPTASSGDPEVDASTARVARADDTVFVLLGDHGPAGGQIVPTVSLGEHVKAILDSPQRAPDYRDTSPALRDQVERLTARLFQTEEALERSKREHGALAGRRSVRLALRVAKRLRPLLLLVRRLRGSGGSRPSGSLPDRRSPYLTRQDAVEAIAGARQTGYPVEGPLVSIIVLSRDGAHHLRVLLSALARTAYSAFELIVVDNASSDDTATVLGAPWPFPVHVIRNDTNVSFSRGNNQGAEHASGELLLMLNNDVEPITDDWLGAMVSAFQDGQPTPSAVGALLVYPETGDVRRDFTIQHRGIVFGFRDGAPHAVNLTGDDPADPELTGVHPVPAATAAALLVSRRDFDGVGGFSGGYFYGAEDVDLCLRLSAIGPIVAQGDAALFHHESATQSVDDRAAINLRRRHNWQHYAEIWSSRITRSVRRDRLTGEGRWTGKPRQRLAAVTLTEDDETKRWGDYYTAHQLGAALEAMGWQVIYAQRHGDDWYDLPDDVGLVINLLDAFDVRRTPSGAVTIAWVRNWVERWLGHPWFEEYDAVVAGSRSAADAIRATTVFDPVVVPLAADPEVFAPGAPEKQYAADYAFTGNHWGVERSIGSLVEVGDGERFAVYGKGWEDDLAVKEHWRGAVDHSVLPSIYRSTPIVLDDTAGPTRGHGLLNARVFEALAAGALVLTDNREGSDEVFGGILPVYDSAESLRALLDRYLGDEMARRDLVDRLRAIVLEHHTYAQRGRLFTDLARAVVDSPRLAIKIGAPDADSMEYWGDLHFARAVARSMVRYGFRGEIHPRVEWDAPHRQGADVVIHLRGVSTYRPKPGAVNVLWVISHPEEVTVDEANGFDLVCVASAMLARSLAGVRVPVILLPQATDARLAASAAPDDDLRCEVLFVGNTRNQRRTAVEWALAADLPLLVYGKGWDGTVPRGYIGGSYFPNDRLQSLYASAKVVLNDHWPQMREFGIVSNRVFDVLAAGGVVVSDAVPGMDELFDGAVLAFRDADELEAVVRRLIDDPEARRSLGERGKAAVLAAHTFDHRAATLVEALRPLVDGRPFDCDGGVLRLAEVQPPVE
jgi:O-antigen biosynthesis protein